MKVIVFTLGSVFGSGGCTVERIDAIIDEHGVTFGSSTGASATDTSAGTSTGDDLDTSGGSLSTGSSGDPSAAETHGGSSSSGDASGTSGDTNTMDSTCGDGIVHEGEGCDDGNDDPDDGCKECSPDSIVFISSKEYQGFALGGLAGADQRCRGLAADAGLPRSGSFRAWLSLPNAPAAGRLVRSRGRYVRIDGAVIARDWDDLTSGALQNPITIDETGGQHETRVWTGTLPSGSPAIPSEFCGDWDDESAVLKKAGEGRSVATDATWSFVEEGLCASENHIYCIEQIALTPPKD